MHKCPNCNTEFEGKFCPECGARWQDEKVCPQCGATLAGGAKFCTECGYSFLASVMPQAAANEPQTPQRDATESNAQAATSDAPEDKEKPSRFTDKRKRLLYRIFGLLPAALLILFSLLPFALYAAPVAVAVLGGEALFGEDAGSESMGNVYQMLGYGEIPRCRAE